MDTTNKIIREGNEKIKNFMGKEFMDKNIFINRLPKDVIQYSENYKLFHNSWDWLMLVVEEIEKLDLIDEFNICYDSVAKGHIVSITPAFRETFNTIITEVYEKKIDAIYDAVIRFIEWYNQNIKLKT